MQIVRHDVFVVSRLQTNRIRRRHSSGRLDWTVKTSAFVHRDTCQRKAKPRFNGWASWKYHLIFIAPEVHVITVAPCYSHLVVQSTPYRLSSFILRARGRAAQTCVIFRRTLQRSALWSRHARIIIGGWRPERPSCSLYTARSGVVVSGPRSRQRQCRTDFGLATSATLEIFFISCREVHFSMRRSTFNSQL